VPIDYTHQHFAADIMQSGEEPHTPIAPGEAQAFTRIGPYRLDFDTDGFVDPADAGPIVFSVDAGSLFCVIPVNVTVFDQPGQVLVQGGEASASPTPGYIGRYTGGALFNADDYLQMAMVEYVGSNSASTLSFASSRWVLAVQNSVVCVAFFTDDQAPTAGAIDVYALIATPA
jgi:hypothetical protein